jgi:hypothetical protein
MNRSASEKSFGAASGQKRKRSLGSRETLLRFFDSSREFISGQRCPKSPTRRFAMDKVPDPSSLKSSDEALRRCSGQADEVRDEVGRFSHTPIPTHSHAHILLLTPSPLFSLQDPDIGISLEDVRNTHHGAAPWSIFSIAAVSRQSKKGKEERLSVLCVSVVRIFLPHNL